VTESQDAPASAGRSSRQWLAAADDDPRAVLLRAYADATRLTIEQLMTTAAPDDAVARAVELLEEANALLAEQPHGRPYQGVAESSMAPAAFGDDARKPFLDYSPVVGLANPLAPPLHPERGEDEISARVVYGAAYEGPPGCVHGGHIAAGFDEVLGFTQTLTGRAGMTGRLQIWYRKPTPLHREVRYTGWVESVDGRKILTRGTLHAGKLLTAEAEGLFIAVDPSLFQRLVRDRPA
jgi:acyl-coenzyme A thioesterase PaaI-like protein